MARMSYFHTVQSLLRKSGQPLARTIATRMRPYSERACRVRKTDCVRHFKARLGDVGGLTSAEQTIERIAIIRRVAVPNQHSRDMRSTKCTTGCLSDDIIHADWCTMPCQLLDNFPAALGSLALEALETRPYCAGITDVKGEKVNFEAAVVGAQFTAAHNADAQTCTSRNRLIVSGNRIVIGNRNGLQVRTLGSPHELDWRNRTIRSSRVSVQIYITLTDGFSITINHRA